MRSSAERRFRFRLALELKCTVAELSRRMRWAEYVEWRMFDAIEPVGFRRSDWQAAMIAQSAMAPHVKTVPPLEKFLPFDERRFDVPKTEQELVLEWDRVLDRAARAVTD